MWLKDGRNEKIRTNVSNKIRHFLNLDPTNVTLYYKEHQKSIKDGSTMKNAEGFKFMYRGDNKPRHQNGKQGQNQASDNSSGRKSFNDATRRNFNGGKMPFEKLGASQGDQVKVYRAKAPSNV